MREIDDIHIPFLAWLRELELNFVYHRPDKKSGIQIGHPDFLVVHMKRAVYIEAKTPEGRLSAVQERVIASIRKNGNTVYVCRSVEECIEAVKNILLEDPAPVLAEPQEVARDSVSGEARESTTPELSRSSQTVEPDSRGGVQFYVGEWQGVPYVFSPDIAAGAFRMIRQASAFDRLTLPKLP